ncbi:hypothetical protein HUE56_00470 (plasmid) [Azospirillum oryzae]|uniref:Uncharacterized protein n=1 Tax=Azospirillum oryzae TaxID=286727 RepID=A0A6N1ABE4_9PROT|nr:MULTISPECIES: hypothetical protein [Azospirillum]KAA0579240.1 hypothetical protein FZ029_07330 [Azospirillum sp. Sh1]KAA0586576.1 hypothetical protein FZ938_20460 [Azospirillum oryzae]QKS49021.1 hypothetical protein HUE56_00470 [Azospirillum oryzae]GLR82219.1 hypothetical protein GCM10007856_49130 [Azospirillum oryzae]
MQTTRQPYEFLVRWDHTGRLCGAHAQFRYITTADDGTMIGEFIGAAEPVAVAGSAGFPLTDILSPLQAAALAERDALAERLAELTASGADSPATA